ncbi:MAG: DUF3179 domain-containing protein, partial [Vicinamibacteria bacterium]
GRTCASDEEANMRIASVLPTMLLLITVGAGFSRSTEVGYEQVKDLLSRYEDVRKAAGKELVEAKDKSLLAAMNDVLYYHYFIRDKSAAKTVSKLMEEIAREKVGSNPRQEWAEWVGRHEEIEPKPGYIHFKRSVFIRYDPTFGGFLNPRFTFRIRPEEIEWGGVKKDGIPPLQEPGHLRASEAKYLKGSDRVFGVYVNGEARAYPHRIMDWHEMCNDVVGGVPVSLSYCTLCGSGILFDGRVGDETFTFSSSGLLYRSNKLMYDRQTQSLWNNLTGEPVVGRLAESGIRLSLLPIVVSTWKEWKTRHPDTVVLDAEKTGFKRDYSKSPYQEYFKSNQTMFPVWLTNDRLGTKDWVYTLIVNGQPKAYPLETMKKEHITHDRVRGKDLVLITEPETGGVRAYESGGKRFRKGTSEDQLVEEGSGAIWKVTEDSLIQESSDEKLPRIPGHNAFWFGWYAFYPTTEVYGRE